MNETIRRQLLQTWESNQNLHKRFREEQFGLMLDLVAENGPVERVLDLCCGPGSISARTRTRFPSASVVGVDVDPLPLDLARGAFATDERVSIADANLHDPGWVAQLPEGPAFDAVLTATAMHWLPQQDYRRVCAELVGQLRPGGLFLNSDHVPVEDPSLRRRFDERHKAYLAAQVAAGVEDSDAWYLRAYATEPELWEERKRRFRHHDGELMEPLSWHREVLLGAGFAAVDEIYRIGNDAIIVAVAPS